MSPTRVLEVLEPGALTTVQDTGRPGFAHLGVPRSGALDAPAAALANRLVGNPADAAVLETTMTGVRVRVGTAMALAVTGAAAPVTVDGRPAAWGQALALHAGQQVSVGPAERGVRCCVAVAGGVAVARLLGSRSTDTLSGLGPAPLRAGDRLPVGPAYGEPGAADVPLGARPGVPARLRVVPGPRADWFTAGALATLGRGRYAVTEESNRVALRLDGPVLERARDDELASEPLVLGAVQVPASGEPLVFLHDHPTTGGYPVIGVVRGEDLAGCAQLRPGEEVGFSVEGG